MDMGVEQLVQKASSLIFGQQQAMERISELFNKRNMSSSYSGMKG
jgi:hypothetical protein